MVGLMYFLGFVSLLLAPFSSGITVVTAAAFFVIGYILSRRRRERQQINLDRRG